MAVTSSDFFRPTYILGARSSSALADFLTFYFKLIFDNVCQVQASLASDMFEQLLRVPTVDSLIRTVWPSFAAVIKAALS